MTREAQIVIDDLFKFEYLNLELLHKNDSLFFENAYWNNTTLFSQDVDFILYVPNNNYTDKDIYLGKQDKHSKYDLPKRNAKGNKLQIFPRYFCYGEKTGSVYQVEFTSVKSMQACLLYLLQQPEITLKIFLNEEEKSIILDRLDKSMKTLSSHQKDLTILKQRVYQKQQEAFLEYANNLYDNQEQFLRFSLLIQITTKSKKALEKKLYTIKPVIKQYQGIIKHYFFEQKHAIEMMYLNYKISNEIKISYIKRTQALKTFPLASLGLYDLSGKDIGKDCFDNQVLFNLWLRSVNRVNSNFIILGQSGMGKTTLLQKLLELQDDDVEIIIFDPENEYTNLFHKKGYKQYIVENEISIDNYMDKYFFSAEQASFLLQHFKLTTNCNYQEQQLFEGILLAFNKSDKKLRFAEFVDAHFAMNEHAIIKQYLNNLRNKKKMMIHSDKRIHHFILSSLIDITTVKLQIVLFELLFYMWQRLMTDSVKKKILVMDESYFVFNEDNYAIIELMRNIVKRARKYNVSIGLISQNLIDFRNPKLIHLLLPIIDNCTYKFIFRLGEFDMKEFMELLMLEHNVAKQIKTLKRGECFLFSGYEYGKLKVE